ncbi:MAG: mycofactocin glycosyltransferase [Blastococcus sp.]|jgi:mycofactocin system glycosyltransferase|nr:mycofactocin glycosyltransferase [Blastococcus sp.]
MNLALPAPPPSRLPDGFAVRLDARTHRRDDGATLLGGSPLRLLRLSARAQALLETDRLVVHDATSAALAARLLDTGTASPDLAPAPVPEVTVVIPVRDRLEGVGRLLTALRADPATREAPIVVVDDGSLDAAAVAALAATAGAILLRHETARGPAAARNAGLRTVTTDAVAFLDSDCVPVAGWLEALAPHLADPRLALVAPRIVAGHADRPGWLSRYEAVAGALDMGAQPAAVRPLSAVSYVPSAALLCRRAALGEGFDDTMQVAEDVDLVWRLAAAGWRIRYEPAAAVAHEHRTATGNWMRRRAFYGTGAALLAARHGSAVAPVILSPSSALVWLLALTGGRYGRLGALAVLGWTTTRLARRLSRPGEPMPVVLPAGLVLRGAVAAGRSLTRAATRHWWPVALPAAVISRRARRWIVAAALADGVGAWWPHRHDGGPVRFVAARRLEDVAYGAGLWDGALRHRQPRALLPARPPRME